MADRDSRRCPATTRQQAPLSSLTFGVQCKYTPGHDGDHAGYAGYSTGGDVFWPQEPEDVKAPSAPPGG